MLIEAPESALLIVDVQARLAPAVAEPETVVSNCARLVEAAGHLDVPVLVSEQYPKGLGGTVPALAEQLGGAAIFAKTEFACSRDPEILEAIRASGRQTVIVCGMEAHVCVLQSALHLAAQGLAPVVVADAISSRNPEHKALALTRLRANGVEVAVTEMVLFEWLGRAGTPAFKAISPLIK